MRINLIDSMVNNHLTRNWGGSSNSLHPSAALADEQVIAVNDDDDGFGGHVTSSLRIIHCTTEWCLVINENPGLLPRPPPNRR